MARSQHEVERHVGGGFKVGFHGTEDEKVGWMKPELTLVLRSGCLDALGDGLGKEEVERWEEAELDRPAERGDSCPETASAHLGRVGRKGCFQKLMQGGGDGGGGYIAGQSPQGAGNGGGGKTLKGKSERGGGAGRSRSEAAFESQQAALTALVPPSGADHT